MEAQSLMAMASAPSPSFCSLARPFLPLSTARITATFVNVSKARERRMVAVQQQKFRLRPVARSSGGYESASDAYNSDSEGYESSGGASKPIDNLDSGSGYMSDSTSNLGHNQTSSPGPRKFSEGARPGSPRPSSNAFQVRNFNQSTVDPRPINSNQGTAGFRPSSPNPAGRTGPRSNTTYGKPSAANYAYDIQQNASQTYGGANRGYGRNTGAGYGKPNPGYSPTPNTRSVPNAGYSGNAPPFEYGSGPNSPGSGYGRGTSPSSTGYGDASSAPRTGYRGVGGPNAGYVGAPGTGYETGSRNPNTRYGGSPARYAGTRGPQSGYAADSSKIDHDYGTSSSSPSSGYESSFDNVNSSYDQGPGTSFPARPGSGSLYGPGPRNTDLYYNAPPGGPGGQQTAKQPPYNASNFDNSFDAGPDLPDQGYRSTPAGSSQSYGPGPSTNRAYESGPRYVDQTYTAGTNPYSSGYGASNQGYRPGPNNANPAYSYDPGNFNTNYAGSPTAPNPEFRSGPGTANPMYGNVPGASSPPYSNTPRNFGNNVNPTYGNISPDPYVSMPDNDPYIVGSGSPDPKFNTTISNATSPYSQNFVTYGADATPALGNASATQPYDSMPSVSNPPYGAGPSTPTSNTGPGPLHTVQPGQTFHNPNYSQSAPHGYYDSYAQGQVEPYSPQAQSQAADVPQVPRESFVEVAKKYGKEQPVMLRFIMLENSIGLALDNVISDFGALPLTQFFFYPENDVLKELKEAMERQQWISHTRAAKLLKQAEQLLSLWQKRKSTAAV
ncbi:hypothetical protein KP509_23G039300 [Ceratopteris richardii]|uniref:30S ribosomal protein 3, chloroplastic n=1 Tax=Ceratopteris richardii TaxID=49495 RepID=A0A8T2S0T5_CERRI|nr:hypothetical protein KP509_23G039300 [Ceratopteris richardii]